MASRVPAVQTAFTAAGMASSLGNLHTACAAIRAGLSRPAEIPHQQVVDFDAHEAVPIVGHPAGCGTEGFAAPARWMILAQAALEDLATRASFPAPKTATFWERTSLIVVTPPLDDTRLLELPTLRADRTPEALWFAPDYSDKILGAVQRALKPYRTIAEQLKNPTIDHAEPKPKQLKKSLEDISESMYTSIMTLATANRAATNRTVVSINNLPPSAYRNL